MIIWRMWHAFGARKRHAKRPDRLRRSGRLFLFASAPREWSTPTERQLELVGGVCRLLPREQRATVHGGGTELLFDAEELVVLGHAIGSGG